MTTKTEICSCGHEKKWHDGSAPELCFCKFIDKTENWEMPEEAKKRYLEVGITELAVCSCKKFTPQSQDLVSGKGKKEKIKPIPSFHPDTQTPEDKKPKVFIERAEPLTIEGIRAICMNDEDYAKYRKDKTSGNFCLSDKIFVETTGSIEVIDQEDVKEFVLQTIEDIENAQEDSGNLDWISKEQAIKIIKSRAGNKLI